MIYKELVSTFLKKYKAQFTIYFILILIIFPIESIVLPQLYGKVFTKIQNKKIDGAFKIINKITSKQFIFIIIAIWVLVILLQISKKYMESNIIPNYLSFLRNKIFSKTIDNYKNNYIDIKVGKSITRILDVSRQINDCLITSLEIIFPYTFGIILIIVFFIYMNKKLSLIAMAGFVITILVSFGFAKKIIKISTTREYKYLEMSEKISDSFWKFNEYLLIIKVMMK